MFGIDYSKMTPTKLRIEEMNRFCYWCKLPYSGSVFGISVLGANDYIVVKWFMSPLYINGVPMYTHPLIYDFLKNLDKQYSLQDILNLYFNLAIELDYMNSDYLSFARYLIREFGVGGKQEFIVSELFKAYFIFRYYNKFGQENIKNVNPRVSPMILFEPHLNAPERNMFYDLVLDFPYHVILGSMREPILSVGRFYQISSIGNKGAGFISVFDYYNYFLNQNIPQNLLDKWYMYRFEDLKLHPKETLMAICEVLNVPYDEKMLNEEAPAKNVDGIVKGFDTQPLHRNVDFALSKFDQMRLQIYFDVILRHFNYPTFDFEECPMNEQEFFFLLKFPFRFENHYIKSKKLSKEETENLRKYFHNNMFTLWKLAKEGHIVLPKVIKNAVK